MSSFDKTFTVDSKGEGKNNILKTKPPSDLNPDTTNVGITYHSGNLK